MAIRIFGYINSVPLYFGHSVYFSRNSKIFYIASFFWVAFLLFQTDYHFIKLLELLTFQLEELGIDWWLDVLDWGKQHEQVKNSFHAKILDEIGSVTGTCHTQLTGRWKPSDFYLSSWGSYLTSPEGRQSSSIWRTKN